MDLSNYELSMLPSPLIVAETSRFGTLAPFIVPFGLGALAVYWLLPRAKPYPPIWGASAAGLAFVAAGWFLMRTHTVSPEVLLFYAFSSLAIVAGGLLITQRNPAYAALSFAVVVLSVCGLFLLQAAPFLMAATTIVYAGAIVVTFLFVIMLAQQHGNSSADQRSREPLLGTIAGFVLLGAAVFMIDRSYSTTELDRYTVQMESTVDRLEALEAKREEGEGISLREAEPVLEEVAELIGLGMKAPGSYTRWWKGNLTYGPLGDRDLEDGSLNPVLRRFEDEVRNAQVPLVIARASIKDGRPPANLTDLTARMKLVLEQTQYIRRHAPHTSSFLQPDDPARKPQAAPRLSEFSGPAADRSLHQVRRSEDGRLHLPADNVSSLGRTLFTDYLLAVEMAGTLLLVATIGAIAITQRRIEKGA